MVLAVAPWGVSAAFLTALILVPGDGWSPASVALVAGAFALSCAGAAHSYSLKQRVSPAVYRRYERARDRAMFACGVIVVVNYAVSPDAEWGKLLIWGYMCLFGLYGLFPPRRTRGVAVRSPGPSRTH